MSTSKTIAKRSPDEICREALARGLVRVDAETGHVYSKRFKPSEPRGVTNLGGYRVCTIILDGQRCQAKLHRIVWIGAKGPIPAGLVIDHINGDKADNRIGNLRLADAALNAANRRSYSGLGNPSARIDRTKADAIRADYVALRSYAKVAKGHGVSKSLVAQIVREELWTS